MKDYDYGLKKILGKPVDRIRLYKRNYINNNNINNTGVDIFKKKFLSNGTLCIKLIFTDNGVQKKYIFLNTNLPLDTKLSLDNNLTENDKIYKTFEYIFDLLTIDNIFFQGNRKNQNLIDLFTEGYDIYFLGNIDLFFLKNIIGDVLKSIKKSNGEINKTKNHYYNNLILFISEYFSEKKNSIMNKKNLKIKKPSIIGSKKNKNDYLKEFTQFKKEYEEKIFNFFIKTILIGNNIFYTSLKEKSNSNIVNIM
jgi:hypothetical protein